MEIKQIGGLPGHERKGGGFQTGYAVFDSDGICLTLLADGGGYGIIVLEDSMDIDKTRQDKTRQVCSILSTRVKTLLLLFSLAFIFRQFHKWSFRLIVIITKVGAI